MIVSYAFEDPEEVLSSFAEDRESILYARTVRMTFVPPDTPFKRLGEFEGTDFYDSLSPEASDDDIVITEWWDEPYPEWDISIRHIGESDTPETDPTEVDFSRPVRPVVVEVGSAAREKFGFEQMEISLDTLQDALDGMESGEDGKPARNVKLGISVSKDGSWEELGTDILAGDDEVSFDDMDSVLSRCILALAKDITLGEAFAVAIAIGGDFTNAEYDDIEYCFEGYFMDNGTESPHVEYLAYENGQAMAIGENSSHEYQDLILEDKIPGGAVINCVRYALWDDDEGESDAWIFDEYASYSIVGDCEA